MSTQEYPPFPSGPRSQIPQMVGVTRSVLGIARQTLGSALIAAAAAVAASYAVRLVAAVPTPAEVFGDRLTVLIPLPVFSRLLALFGTSAKHWYFGGVSLCEALMTVCVGALYWGGRARWLSRRQSSATDGEAVVPGIGDAIVLMLLLYLLSAALLSLSLGAGVLGSGLTGGVPGTFVSELVPNLVFAIAFVLLLRRVAPRAAGDLVARDARGAGGVGRRRLLRDAAIAAGILAGGALIWEALANGVGSALGLSGPGKPQLTLSPGPSRIVPPPIPEYGPWSPVAGQTPEITSAAAFYYVSKNLVGDPAVDAASWRLDISGMVSAPSSLTYDELRALPRIERYHTLECISNEVGGNLMSNGLFAGVGLADLLNQAGIQPGASDVIFRAADGYSDRLHLTQALDPRSLVVYLLDGAPLPQPHGYPARLLIPGLYGMKNGKWLTSLQVSNGDYSGYWEQRGWTPEAIAKLASRIDVPHDGDLLLARPTFVAGVAYAADKGIARVDVSTDGGRTWQQANLKRPLSALTWVLWEYQWTPESGQHTLVVRAIDLEGNVQTPLEAPTLPDGASGYDAISVVVR